jgi:hypothetical protein
MSRLSAQFVSYLDFCPAMFLLFSAYYPGSIYSVYLELVLLETCTEIFCNIFWQTHIYNRVAVNTCCWLYILHKWLTEKCITKSKCDDSWRKYAITNCYCCWYAACQGLAGQQLAVMQEEIHPVHQHLQTSRKPMIQIREKYYTHWIQYTHETSWTNYDV